MVNHQGMTIFIYQKYEVNNPEVYLFVDKMIDVEIGFELEPFKHLVT